MPAPSKPVGRRRGGEHATPWLFALLFVFCGCGDAAVEDTAARDLDVAEADPDGPPDTQTDIAPETVSVPDIEADTGDSEPDTTTLDTAQDTHAGPDISDTPGTDTPDSDTDTSSRVDTDSPDTDTLDTDTSSSFDTDTPDVADTDTEDTDAEDTDTEDTDAEDTDSSDTTADSRPHCSPCAIGRVRFERRQPNPAASALGPLELAPLRNHPIGLVGTSDHTLTDSNGHFALPLPAGATCHLGFAALWPRDPALPFAAPQLAILSSDATTLPHLGGNTFLADHLWAWTTNCQPDTPLDLVIRLSEGSGALTAFETAHNVLAALTDHFGPTELDLAIVWQRGQVWSCGSCYLDARFSGVTHTASGHHFPRAIFLSGNNANPHHFTPSIIAHELGHFALELWSSPPLIGGAHGFDRRVAPVLAWSEGAATVIGQWALGDRTPAPQRFFAVQQNVQYWVDLEAIGRSPMSDDSNLDLFVPLPRPLDPLDQPLSEGVVAAILWDLLDTFPEVAGEVIALGPLLLSLLSDPRLADVRNGGLDRAALGPDLVDLLDALRCDPALHDLVGPPSTLPAPLTNLLLEFPYDDLPLCPSGPP